MFDIRPLASRSQRERILAMESSTVIRFAERRTRENRISRAVDALRRLEDVETDFFGTHEEVDREVSRVARLHARVRGALEAPAGRYPAGSAYSAADPEFLLWILACLADSAEVTYRAFVRDLDAEESERFWQD